MKFLDQHIDDIKLLCKEHRVKQLYAFGSVLTENFTSFSDVDLVVDFEQIAVLDYFDNYYDLKFSLEDLLNKPIDLLEDSAIKNPYFKQAIDQQKQLIYEC